MWGIIYICVCIFVLGKRDNAVAVGRKGVQSVAYFTSDPWAVKGWIVNKVATSLVYL